MTRWKSRYLTSVGSRYMGHGSTPKTSTHGTGAKLPLGPRLPAHGTGQALATLALFRSRLATVRFRVSLRESPIRITYSSARGNTVSAFQRRLSIIVDSREREREPRDPSQYSSGTPRKGRRALAHAVDRADPRHDGVDLVVHHGGDEHERGDRDRQERRHHARGR